MIDAIDAASGVTLARPALRTHLMYESRREPGRDARPEAGQPLATGRCGVRLVDGDIGATARHTPADFDGGAWP